MPRAPGGWTVTLAASQAGPGGAARAASVRTVKPSARWLDTVARTNGHMLAA